MQLVSMINIPRRLELLIVREDVIIPTGRCWRDGMPVGLEFSGRDRLMAGAR